MGWANASGKAANVHPSNKSKKEKEGRLQKRKRKDEWFWCLCVKGWVGKENEEEDEKRKQGHHVFQQSFVSVLLLLTDATNLR